MAVEVLGEVRCRANGMWVIGLAAFEQRISHKEHERPGTRPTPPTSRLLRSSPRQRTIERLRPSSWPDSTRRGQES